MGRNATIRNASISKQGSVYRMGGAITFDSLMENGGVLAGFIESTFDPFEYAYQGKLTEPAWESAPTRSSTLPTTAAERKAHPVASGVLDYFPDAITAIAHVSYVGNEQHNPGQPLHWDRAKSTDEADALMRHFMERGKLDNDGLRHTAKMAWRALALLQKEIERERM